jgi:hypothetical protein
LTQRFAQGRRGGVHRRERAVIVDLNWDGALNDDVNRFAIGRRERRERQDDQTIGNDFIVGLE